MRYVKKVPTEAEQFDGSKSMMKKYGVQDNYKLMPQYRGSSMAQFQIKTLEGYMGFNLGDYIATGVDGEHYAINEDVFEKTYKPLKDGDDDE